jgi:aromatic ring-cleaving dioxygenase
MGCLPQVRYRVRMAEQAIRDFHAHIYYDAGEVELAKQLAAAAQARFPVAVGHFHLQPVGPHPRGSCQLTVPTGLFGDVAQWLVLNRGPLTIFAHANTGDDLADHTHHVIWFGPSESLDLSIFG